MDRSKLPYRKEVSVFLFNGNKVMAQYNGKFVIFPGGGVDSGEKLETALRREVVEETGAVIGDLKLITDVKSDFYPEWALVSDKRKERYEKFRGGHIFIYVGTIKKFVKPTSDEGDEWIGNIWMNTTKVIKLIESIKTHSNDIAFRNTQKTILFCAKYFLNKSSKSSKKTS